MGKSRGILGAETTAHMRFLLCGVEKAREGSLDEARRAAKDAVGV